LNDFRGTDAVAKTAQRGDRRAAAGRAPVRPVRRAQIIQGDQVVMDRPHEALLKAIYRRTLDRAARSARISRFVPPGLEPFCDIRRRKPAFAPATIFDVGAHRGESAIRFHRACPDARIVAFEPVRGVFLDLQAKTANISKLECFQYALGDQTQNVRIRLNPKSSTNSLLNERTNVSGSGSGDEGGDSDENHETVSVMTLDSFCAAHDVAHIDFLKIDAEGYDLYVLEGARGMLESERISFVQVETRLSAASDNIGPELTDMINFLGDLHFVPFGFYHQTHEWSGAARLRFLDAVFINRAYT